MDKIFSKNILVNKLKMYQDQSEVILDIIKKFENSQTEYEKDKISILNSFITELIDELKIYIEDHTTFNYVVYNS